MLSDRSFAPSTTDAELYKRYAPSVFAYLLRQLSSREDAEDLLLEVFLAVLEKRQRAGLDEQRLQALIWTIARNKVIDHYRRHHNHQNVSLKEITDTIAEKEELAPEHVMLKQEEYVDLHQAIKQLPGLQQEVLSLRFDHDLSCAEIGITISKSEGAVRTLLYRTLKSLRMIYKRDA